MARAPLTYAQATYRRDRLAQLAEELEQSAREAAEWALNNVADATRPILDAGGAPLAQADRDELKADYNQGLRLWRVMNGLHPDTGNAANFTSPMAVIRQLIVPGTGGA
jgi:hypothetical protein